MLTAMMHGGTMMDGGAGDTVLVILLVLLAVVAGAALAWIAQSRRDVGGGADAIRSRTELDRRYAAGEVSRDDYLQRRRDIET
jgi:uncharacterized membrane protein